MIWYSPLIVALLSASSNAAELRGSFSRGRKLDSTPSEEGGQKSMRKGMGKKLSSSSSSSSAPSSVPSTLPSLVPSMDPSSTGNGRDDGEGTVVDVPLPSQTPSGEPTSVLAPALNDDMPFHPTLILSAPPLFATDVPSSVPSLTPSLSMVPSTVQSMTPTLENSFSSEHQEIEDTADAPRSCPTPESAFYWGLVGSGRQEIRPCLTNAECDGFEPQDADYACCQWPTCLCGAFIPEDAGYHAKCVSYDDN